MFKELPVGNEEFSSLRENNCYYVDKTPYLKVVFANPASVLLITRPRRFGKTLLMNMFSAFLSVAKDGSPDLEYKKKLFSGLEILKDQDFVNKYMGQFGVIALSLKDVKGTSFKEAYEQLADLVFRVAQKYAFLLQSQKISDEYKQILRKINDYYYLSDLNSKVTLCNSLLTLSQCLYEHFGKRVVILIDEYDVPLAKASENGYHQEMVSLISSFYGVMKISPSSLSGVKSPIAKVVLTGCLKVAKNSIFTGVNNFEVNTVLSDDPSLDAILGFTKDETLQFLKDYVLLDKAKLVQENYDGYRFNDKEIFCPWDVVCFVNQAFKKKLHHEDKKIFAENFWANSSSDPALQAYIGYLSAQDNAKVQDLMDGLSIESTINEAMNYDDLKIHRSSDFFSLLLHTGYLTACGYRVVQKDGVQQIIYSLKIPNKEIRNCFSENIVKYFNYASTMGKNKAKIIAKALLEGDCETANDCINELLQSYVSIRDFATRAKPENFYHGFMSGILTNCESYIQDFASNTETGSGYADISFKDFNKHQVVIIELKVSNSDDTLVADAKRAIEQIEELNYAQDFLKKPSIKHVLAYGLSFYKKDCWLKVQKIK